MLSTSLSGLYPSKTASYKNQVGLQRRVLGPLVHNLQLACPLRHLGIAFAFPAIVFGLKVATLLCIFSFAIALALLSG